MREHLQKNLSEMGDLLPRLAALAGPLHEAGRAMLACWGKRGKVLTAGNGGSAADALHLAEELTVRFQKHRRALAALALLDATAMSCAGNDLGYAEVFARQVEALGNPGDVLVVFSTSGNSESVVRAVARGKEQDMVTVAFLGRDGGKLRGRCDVDLIVPSDTTHHIQEAHELLFHTLCQWIDDQVD